MGYDTAEAEAQAGTRYKAVYLIEAGKDLLAPVGRDAYAGVGHRELEVTTIGREGCADGDLALRRELDGIAEQAAHQQLQHGIIGLQHKVRGAVVGVCDGRDGSVADGIVYDVGRNAAGHSCGGAQVLYNAQEPRLRTYIILNAGMGKMEMAGASQKNLKQLHAPIIYMTGGTSDVAYKNAEMDYNSIRKVPAVWADNAQAGHTGTYNQPFGGSFARMVIDWLDLQLKNKQQKAEGFRQTNTTIYPEWTIRSK